MQKLLVAIDGSDSSIRALRFALALPQSTPPVELHLLNVQDYPIVYNEYLTSAMIDAVREAQDQQSRKIMGAATALIPPEISHREHVVVGFADQVIVDRAAALGCQQIVMGTRGLGTFKSLVLGSVAQKVIHHAQVPVTLVK